MTETARRYSVRQRTKTTITLVVLTVGLIAAAAWGFGAALKPLPKAAETIGCVPTTYDEGDLVAPENVLINVLNASKRAGLASRTMQMFEDAGFAAGQNNNAPANTSVGRAQIWTNSPTSPDVRLVRSWLGKGTKIVQQPTTAQGVVVVVGDNFEKLAVGRPQVKAQTATEICSPPS